MVWSFCLKRVFRFVLGPLSGRIFNQSTLAKVRLLGTVVP